MTAKKKSELAELSSGFKDLFTHKNWSALWQTYNLTRKWPEIVGNDIAKNSEPAYIQNGTLWVYVQNSVLMQHMQHQKLTLIHTINGLFPDAEIDDIRWAMQPAKPSRAPNKQKEHSAKVPDRKTREAFEAMSSTVENNECRNALQKLWVTFHNRHPQEEE